MGPHDQIKLGKENDPEQHRGYVSYRIDRGAKREDVILGLISRGLDRPTATRLVDETLARMVAIRSSRAVGFGKILRGLVFGLVGSFGTLALWVFLVLYVGGRRPFMALAIGVVTGFFVLLSRWGAKAEAFKVLAVLFAAAAMAAGHYMMVDPYAVCTASGVAVLDPLPLSSFPMDCLKENLIGSYEIGWAIAGLVAAWWLAGREWIRPA